MRAPNAHVPRDPAVRRPISKAKKKPTETAPRWRSSGPPTAGAAEVLDERESIGTEQIDRVKP
jgi:hypothetical protein